MFGLQVAPAAVSLVPGAGINKGQKESCPGMKERQASRPAADLKADFAVSSEPAAFTCCGLEPGGLTGSQSVLP